MALTSREQLTRARGMEWVCFVMGEGNSLGSHVQTQCRDVQSFNIPGIRNIIIIIICSSASPCPPLFLYRGRRVELDRES